MVLENVSAALKVPLPTRILGRRAARRSLVVRNSSDKTNIKEVGLNSVENDTVRNNLMGKSRFMDKKGWVDSQGRKVSRKALAPAAARASARVRSDPLLHL